MANDFNYNLLHSRPYYAPVDNGKVKKGAVMFAHSKEDEPRVKELGYTSTSYVTSEWPKTAFHKKTGDSRPIGKFEDSDEENKAALARLGPDWGLTHVPAQEVAPRAAGADLNASDLRAVIGLKDDLALLVKRIDELEEAAIAHEGIRVAQESRISELESTLEAAMGAAAGKKKA